MPDIAAQPSAKKKTNSVFSKDLRPLHRIIGSIIMLFTLYFAVTGSMVQLVDLKAVISRAPATDPEMLAIRESIDGTPNYSVIQATDYTATPLPDNFDYDAALANVASAMQTRPDGTLKYLELRMLAGKPIVLAQIGDGAANQVVRIDPATGTILPNPPQRQRQRPAPSLHNEFKRWHRLQQLNLGDEWEWVNGVIGLGLFLMIITGIFLYFRLLRARSRAGLKGFFWSSGGFWRSAHRAVAILSALFLLVVSITGALLSMESVGLGIYMNAHQDPKKPGRQFPFGMIGDLSSPLSGAELPGMLRSTLAAYHADKGNLPVKVVRVRYYSGMPQGLVIYGNGDSTSQVVYNTATGQRTSTTEPGYPYTGFPLGWKWHERVKEIHRGDIIGIPGRLMDLFAAFSLIYLSISGFVMYFDVWKKRRRMGKLNPFWT